MGHSALSISMSKEIFFLNKNLKYFQFIKIHYLHYFIEKIPETYIFFNFNDEL